MIQSIDGLLCTKQTDEVKPVPKTPPESDATSGHRQPPYNPKPKQDSVEISAEAKAAIERSKNA